MCKFSKLLTLCFLFFTIFVTAQEATVIKIIDADSYYLRLDKQKQTVKVRLARVDCPEWNTKQGKIAKQYVIEKLLYRKVKITARGYDKYSRLLVDIYLEGKWFQADLIDKGLARHYKYYDSNEILAAKEFKAKQKKLGIWKN